jgi:uncharacterized protein YbbC (DUF1343 family)
MHTNGIDLIVKDPISFQNKKWALVTNDAAYTKNGKNSRLALIRAGISITKLFSPEHGIDAQGADGAKQDNRIDPLTHLPVISLYGSSWLPQESDLKDVDGVLFDIPDIGCRYYTYMWTMTFVMEACAKYGKPLIILDRPNPTGTLLEDAEGPWLDEIRCSSFIGRWNIPVVHACTLGELANYFAGEKFPDLSLEIIRVKDYSRSARTLQHPFLPTSPAMQTLETTLLYPGTCLFEGVNINEGRGTAHPFTQFGALWLNADKLMASLDSSFFKGIDSNVVRFLAASNPYENEYCEGIRFKIIDAKSVRPVRMGIHLLQQIAKLHPDKFSERLYCTYANPAGTGHLDKLLGVQYGFEKIKSDYSFTLDVHLEWKNRISKYLLY